MPDAKFRANFWVTENITPWDAYQHGVSRVFTYKKTEYQEMYIVETGTYGKGLVLDGKWQSCTGDEFIYHESLVHPAMALHGNPRKVLILGGGEGATTREVLRWKSVERVLMVDIDGEVVEACKEHLKEMHQGAFDDPRSDVLIGDALNLLDTTEEKWDVVISDLSDPIEEGPSYKLFTQEYYQKVKRVLNKDGFFVLQAGPIGPILNKLYAGLINTVKTVFPNVRPYGIHIPTYASPWGFAVASLRSFEDRLNAKIVDQTLAEKTIGGFRCFDGTTLVGMLHLPLYVRRAIQEEKQVFTLSTPPKFF